MKIETQCKYCRVQLKIDDPTGRKWEPIYVAWMENHDKCSRYWREVIHIHYHWPLAARDAVRDAQIKTLKRLIGGKS